MSLLKEAPIIKYCVITSAAALVLIAVNTILISQKSTKNANTLNIELKNLSSNLESLKIRLKIYRLIWFLQKNNLKSVINVLTIHPFGLTKRGKSCGIG